MNPAIYAKAIVGAIIAGLSAIVTALDDDTITSQEWAIAGVALLTALGVVWAIPNSDA